MDGLGTVSYWVAPAGRGRGIAPRALREVSAWALHDLGLHRIEVEHSTANAASCRVAAKAGYVWESTKRSQMLHFDGWHDMHLHVMLPDRSPGDRGLPDYWNCRSLSPSAGIVLHPGRVALDIILIGLGWLLAGSSAVLRLRESPGLRPRHNSLKPSWRSNALLLAAIAVATYGGSAIQLRHQHWGFWVVLAVLLPLCVIAAGVPSAVRWLQLRGSTSRPARIDNAPRPPPAA